MREKLLGLLLGGQGIRPAEKICNISYSRRLRFDKGAQKVKLRAFLDRHGSSNGTSFLLTGLCVNPTTTFTPTTHHIFTTTTTRCITLLSLSPRFCTLPNKKSVRCSLCINIGVHHTSSTHSHAKCFSHPINITPFPRIISLLRNREKCRELTLFLLHAV